MRLKKELYKKQQIELSLKIVNLLELDENNQIILYHLDNDINKINNIMSLMPDLRKFFSFTNIKGIESPEMLKRPYLSIIRQVTKLTHTMKGKDKQLKINGNIIRSRILTFKKIEIQSI